MKLTVCYTTSRQNPKIEWFFASLDKQLSESDCETIKVIVVDYFASDSQRHLQIAESLLESGARFSIRHVTPKPTIWQGKCQIPAAPWWAKSNALNTGIILCETEWIAFADDRSVLGLHWLESVERAMQGNYAVCGSYEKWANLYVKDGSTDTKGDFMAGELLGRDMRTPGCYPFDSWYGGSGALLLEWCLSVNGFDEPLCDSLGSEDSMFGVCLQNSGYPIFYDSEMRIIEDRTPSEIGGALKRADKNAHLGQKAKSWDIVRAFRGRTKSTNEFDIRNVRDRVLLNHESLDSILPVGSKVDWYDNQPISEME